MFSYDHYTTSRRCPGKTISLAGPSILLIYTIIGTMFFFLMRALGEILLSNLHYKSFIDMAHDLIGPGAGYYIGWSYWLGWVLVGIADLAAIINYLSFWLPEGMAFTPSGQAMISVACVLLVLGINMLAVRLFGEIEFWFALIKILAILGLIGIGGFMVFNHFHAPGGSFASFSNVWSHGGMFPQGGSGFLAGFQIALFAFVGVELIGTMAAETQDPEKNLPKGSECHSDPDYFVLCVVAVHCDVGDPMEPDSCGSKSLCVAVHACGYWCSSDYHEPGGAVIGHVLHEQRCVFNIAHAVWLGAGRAGSAKPGAIVQACRACQRFIVLLCLYYGGCSITILCTEYS